MTLPDCSAAGLANSALAIGALGGFEPVVQDALVPTFYASCVGCQPTEAAMAATDGVTLLGALQRAVTAGFDVGQPTPLFPATGPVATNRASLAHAMDQFGGAYVGIRLYERDMEMLAVWDADGSDPGALVGRHCVFLWDFLGLGDQQTGRMATWGAFQTFTWRWLASRLDEAHALFFRQLAPAQASAVDEDRLAAEIKSAT
jgi:hypothetical protein